MKVLIADDSSVSRRLLEATLKRWDYEVEVACDGDEALEMLRRPGGPTLAILDWMMPSLTGPEVCRQVRQESREPYVYILLLTSRSQKEDLIEGMESGADDYLVKPFDQNELKVRLRAGRRILDLQAELLRAREALHVQATHDSLTGLFNRRAVLDMLQSEMHRAERERSHVGVILCDLDHFKKVNDTHGHAMGDAVLQEAAHRMSRGIRAYDAIGRYGGEEFLIVLPGCDQKSCTHQAERLSGLLSHQPIIAGNYNVTVTGSFGCTAWGPETNSTLEALIAVADDALYQAKRQGRNRVVSQSLKRALASSE
jgi:diguanylate cyclase (GGDEF)-like protein